MPSRTSLLVVRLKLLFCLALCSGQLVRPHSTAAAGTLWEWEQALGAPGKQQWPPEVCGNRGKGHGSSHEAGALTLFCASGDARFQVLWQIGKELLGERSLVTLARRSRAFYVTFGGEHLSKSLPAQFLVWHDGLDATVQAVVQEMSDDVYRLHRFSNLTASDWVFDLGGHMGLVPVLMRLHAPEVNIITVEPSPWNYVLLRLNLLVNVPSNLPEVIALHAGLGLVHDRRIEGTHFSTAAWASSIGGSTRSARLAQTGGVRFNVSTVALPRLMQRYRIRHIAVMKLDCEGCEWEVGFDWLRRGFWGRVGHIVGEFHMFNPVCYSALHYPKLRVGLECFPGHLLTFRDALRVWRLLCRVPKFEMSGCTEDHLAMLSLRDEGGDEAHA
mmetsp:Transcript_73335/g.203485  ORF Transcript_73335/g.203485 Transcript_73335/m.203485 type:complete len:386 (-) Transcript_73335:57-1214(-)